MNMDPQVHGGNCSSCDAQQPVVASVYPSLEHWSSTSFQSLSAHEVLSVSSLVPSTVLTLVPHYELSVAGENSHPEPGSLCDIKSEPGLGGTLSSGNQDQTAPVLRPPCSDSILEVQPRKPADGGPLEEGSVGLTLPKDGDEEETGMS